MIPWQRWYHILCRAPYGYTFAEIGEMTVAQIFAALEEPKQLVTLSEGASLKATFAARKARWIEVTFGN